MAFQIKKAVILAAGSGTRFLPYSRLVSKEFFPLGDRPMIEYIVEEVFLSGIEEIIFVLNPDKQQLVNYISYFQNDETAIEKLKSKNNKKLLEDYCRLKRILKKITISYVYQEIPRGDGDAVLKARSLLKKDEPIAVLFCDDIIYSKKEPGLKQLINVFQKKKKPVFGLSRVRREKISSYGIVKGEKVGNKIYLIKGVVEKPKLTDAPSNLAIIGKYILTSKVLDYLQRIDEKQGDEIRIAGALKNMIKDKNKVFGCEFDGIWLECGTKEDWLRSNFFITEKMLKHET
ncbi:MAG: sugar phosphate nucleotidyltransferase [bacterium]|nr:sugar phosphate nucleotidyltransferase [bacterium]